jgi:hypothetical protein
MYFALELAILECPFLNHSQGILQANKIMDQILYRNLH